MKRCPLCVLVAARLLLAVPAPAQDQPVPRAAGPQYGAGALHRLFLGSEYRDLWTTPFGVAPLDLETFAGGLVAVARTGGEQTKTLRLRAADGREFFFRSLDKDPAGALPPDLRGTVASSVVRDQTKSALPTAPLVVAQLLTAAGILHADPHIVMLPDDSLLGEFRADFRGLIGTLEARLGGRGPNAHWGGATEIIDSDSLFALADASADDRVDAPAFLRARLFDILIGDWDRHRDQWRWARFSDTLPRAWQPIPIDRDQAFAKFDGVLLGVARQAAPQLTNFGPDYPGMIGATWNGRELDRRFLVGLERPVWDSVARSLSEALTDSVLAQAVRALPPEHRTIIGFNLDRWLRHRRDHLPEAADRFYRLLARQVDVHATAGPDHATATRSPDGALTLTLRSGPDSAPYLERRFHRGETGEIRLFLGEGPDTALVRGQGSGMTLRVLGDGGADVLVDSTRDGPNRFYDDSAAVNRTAGLGAPVDRRPYVLPTRAPRALPPRDWGHRWQASLWASYGPDVGLFIGGGQSLTTYAFRKLPFASRHRLRAGFATGPSTYRADYRGEFHRENSGIATVLLLRASGIDVIRFHGFGNESKASGNDEFYRVTQNQVTVSPSLLLPLAPRLALTLGPELKYVDTDNRPNRFLATLNPYGVGDFGELGFRASLRLDTRNRPTAATRGATLELGGVIHPGWWDVAETFGDAYAVATTYLSPRAPLDPTLSLRAGARKLWGSYPFFESAFIGDRTTVRLGRDNRYAGDASVYGTAELRLSLGRTTLVVPTDFGVFGLADAGRVFLSGESSDQWHSAFGGGIWLGFLTRANTISAALAASEERTRVYIQAGFGF